MKYKGLILLIILLMSLVCFIWIGLILISAYLKKFIFKMNEYKWDNYFKQIGTKGIILRAISLYLIALSLNSLIAYQLFNMFNYEKPLLLTILVVSLSILMLSYKLIKNKTKLLIKLEAYKKHASAC